MAFWAIVRTLMPVAFYLGGVPSLALEARTAQEYGLSAAQY